MTFSRIIARENASLRMRRIRAAGNCALGKGFDMTASAKCGR
jgi:hypothetical protein